LFSLVSKHKSLQHEDKIMTEQDKSTKPSVSDKTDEEISDENLKDVAGGVRPPSGDSNPSDAFNRTVDGSDIIEPNSAK
jgi:hypothetical protein